MKLGSYIKNINKTRVTTDRLQSHLKKIGATNGDQESINDMLCILQCKGAIDDNLTLAKNKEDLTHHEGIDIRISHVISNYEKSYCISNSNNGNNIFSEKSLHQINF